MTPQSIRALYAANAAIAAVSTEASAETLTPEQIELLTEQFRQALIQKATASEAISFGEVHPQLPAALESEIQAYLAANPQWNEERLITAALSLFLMQSGSRSPVVSRLYLNTLFDL
jgi:hypothetical protein